MQTFMLPSEFSAFFRLFLAIFCCLRLCRAMAALYYIILNARKVPSEWHSMQRCAVLCFIVPTVCLVGGNGQCTSLAPHNTRKTVN